MTEDTIFTVHPYDKEWTWDSKRSGSHPWATASLEAAIEHANLVRLEYANVAGIDSEFVAGFWSAIYDESRDDEMLGWVDPLGEFQFGVHPSVKEEA
jgi:hypothetical protein